MKKKLLPRPPSKPRRRRSPLIFLGAMLCFGAIGLIGLVPRSLAQQTATRTGLATGKVVSLLHVHDRPLGGSVHVMVSFETPQHEMITFTDPVGANPSLHQVGDTVVVAFNPVMPSDADIPQDVERQVNFARNIGIVFACLGVLSFWGAWHLQKKQGEAR
ncbi:MAG: DUF3592 domain-containing protein [Candidatus Xenobia bacterium]